MRTAADLADRLRAIGGAVAEATPGAAEAGAYELKTAIQRQIARRVGPDMKFSNAGAVNVNYRHVSTGVRSTLSIRPVGPVHWLERGTSSHTIRPRRGVLKLPDGNPTYDGDIGVRPSVTVSGVAARPVWRTGRAAGTQAARDVIERTITDAIREV